MWITIFQKKPRRILGYIPYRELHGRRFARSIATKPFFCKRLFFTTYLYRYIYYLDGSQNPRIGILAYGLRDAQLLPEFQIYNEEIKI